MLPSNIKIISNYQLYPTPGPVPSQLCFVSRRMNEENVPLPAHHQETVPGPQPPPDRTGGEGGGGPHPPPERPGGGWGGDVWLLSSWSGSSLGSVWPGGVRQPCDGGGSHTDTQSRIVSTTCPTVQYTPGDIIQPYTVTPANTVTEQRNNPAHTN